MAGGPSGHPARKVATLAALRKQWAQCPGRSQLRLKPKGVTASLDEMA